MNDVLAVENEIHRLPSKHSDKPNVHPAAAQLIARIEDTIDRHLVELKRALERLGGSESKLKQAAGAAVRSGL
jgi:hypothetical protein